MTLGGVRQRRKMIEFIEARKDESITNRKLTLSKQYLILIKQNKRLKTLPNNMNY